MSVDKGKGEAVPKAVARLRSDDGVSLVEMLVALFLVSVALLALLGSLVAGLRSSLDQRARTAATRVATEHLEGLRRRGFDELRMLVASGVTDSVTLDGRTYGVATVLTEVDAEDPSLAPSPGRPTVIQASSTVDWAVGATARTSVFTTAVAPTAATVIGGAAGGQTIDSVNFVPSPTEVDGNGVPTQDIEGTVALSGFDGSAIVQVRWSDDLGTHVVNLVSHDSGVTWGGTISATLVKRVIAAGETAPGLDFTVEAGSLSRLYTLPLTRQPSTSLAITSTSIQPTPITVARPSPNCNGSNKCTNTQTFTFAATVDGLDPVDDTLRLKYQLRDGSFEELGLGYDAAAGLWRTTVAVGSTKFKPGPTQPFVFTALRSADGASASMTEEVLVAEVSG